MNNLTGRQKRTLDFIQGFIEKNDYAPSLEEIAKGTRVKSPGTVAEHLERLEMKGYLKRYKGEPRSIIVSENEPMVQIPLLGLISAGQPIDTVVEEKETIAVQKSKLPKSGEIFALKVTGDSMVDEGINDSDIILVKQQKTAENGQRVVALIDNYDTTLKKFYKEKRHIRLQPANRKLEPVIVQKGQEFEIQGVVIDVIKTASQKTTREEGRRVSSAKRRGPRGGCELTYPEKVEQLEVLTRTHPARLTLLRKHKTSTKNKLILGDNLPILKSLYGDKSIRGKVSLVYIDPPFGTGQDFVGYNDENAYSDKLIDAEFLEFIRRRLIFLRELLADSGSIYVHIDQKIGHYIKMLMDEIFGEENFRNDITRIKCNPKNFERKAFGNIKDVIYFYSKSKPNGGDKMTWTNPRLPLSEEDIAKQFPKIDKHGRRYATTPLHAKGETSNGPTGQPWNGLNPPKGRHWRYPPRELTKLDKQGLIKWSSTGNPRKIIYADENPGKKIQDIWNFKDPGYEKSLYPTEKNEDLLKQIILASSNKGDLVLDCFVGSGTTPVAAEKLERRWIGIDSNPAAIKVTERRMLSIGQAGTLFDRPITFGVYKAT